MSDLLEITQLGHPILRKKAKKVSLVQLPEVQSLVDDMLVTLANAGGLGIAAPQINESLRIIVVASHPTPRYPAAPEMEPTAMINPEILVLSEQMGDGWEGCLSIPGIRAIVPRHRRVSVRYRTRDGAQKEDAFDGFVARIFQHEYDHLNGIVYLDRIIGTRNIVSEKEFLRLMEENRTT